MKRIAVLLLTITMTLGLCSCGNAVPTWQEQYDLGIKYLSEGNYEEAILAFTAAIEIDPKQVQVYVSRAEAYICSGETEENMAAALADYETALELDDTLIEAWLGLADVYIRQGKIEKAIEVLNKALEKVGEEPRIADRLNELEPEEPEEQVDYDSVSLSLDGTGKNMKVSLTIPGLPEEFFVDSSGANVDVGFEVAFSDGEETFAVYSFEKYEGEGMVAGPDNTNWENWFGAYLYEPGEGAEYPSYLYHLMDIEPVREEDTIIWKVQLPDWAFSVEEIQFIDYGGYYSTEAEGEDVRFYGCYTVLNDTLIYDEDAMYNEDGYYKYIISEEEASRRGYFH